MWKKIDSAPKDGSHILLLMDGAAIEGWWYAGVYSAYAGEHIGEGWEVISLHSHGCGCCSSSNGPPTHWMALPEKEETNG